MTHIDQTGFFESITLDGQQYPIQGGIGYRNLARWENRIIIGDPTLNDDELVSARVYSDFSGGGGIYDEREGADQGRYWESMGVEITHPRQIAALPEINRFTGSSATAAYMLGEVGNTLLVAFNKNVYSYAEGTFPGTVTDTTNDLGFEPVNPPVTYGALIYVPQGSNGYQTVNSSGVVVNGTAGITPTAMCLWDDKLCVIEHNGQFSFYDGSAWTSPSTAILPSNITPRNIFSYFNRSDEPNIYVLTTEAIYGYDPVSQVLIQTNVKFPKHPDQGRGVAVWHSGENCQFSVGMGVYQWTGPGGTIAPSGLDRDEGVPSEYTGYITGMDAGLNDIFATVKSVESGGYNSLWAWNGTGWFTVWRDANNTNAIHYPMVTQANGVYRVWWDMGGYVYTMKLPRGHLASRERIKSSSWNYSASALQLTTQPFLITSWYDANMPAFDKLMSHISGETENLDAANNYVKISYQTDLISAWTELVDMSDAAFLLNPGKWVSQTDFSFTRIRFKLVWYCTNSSLMIKSLVPKYLKVPTSYRTWNVNIPIAFDGEYVGRDAHTIKEEIEALLIKRTFITFLHNQDSFRVRISSEQGGDHTAMDQRGNRQITIVEVPVAEPAVVAGNGGVVQAS